MPAQSNAEPAPGTVWRVVSQKEAMSQNDSGQLVTGVQVYFQVIASGVQQSVFIPFTEYTPERVKAVIDARVQTITAIHNLNG